MVYFKDYIKIKNQIDILPMIDIIFSILAFLIISSLYLTRVDTMSIELPKASNSINQNKKFINISINKAGDLFINKKPTEIKDLKLNVIDLTNKQMNLVVLSADKNLSHGYIISVLDELRSINGLKLSISTKSID